MKVFDCRPRVQMLSAITMIGLILVQHGKGADMGASFGSGLGQPVRRVRQRELPVALDGRCATIFFICTLALAYFATCAAPSAAAASSSGPPRRRRRRGQRGHSGRGTARTAGGPRGVAASTAAPATTPGWIPVK